MTTTRTPAHPEPSAARHRRSFPLVLRLSKGERTNHASHQEPSP